MSMKSKPEFNLSEKIEELEINYEMDGLKYSQEIKGVIREFIKGILELPMEIMEAHQIVDCIEKRAGDDLVK